MPMMASAVIVMPLLVQLASIGRPMRSMSSVCAGPAPKTAARESAARASVPVAYAVPLPTVSRTAMPSAAAMRCTLGWRAKGRACRRPVAMREGLIGAGDREFQDLGGSGFASVLG